jgi:hypothetical protein
MFSSLPKLADKNFIIGFLLPALLAILTALFLFNDMAPNGSLFDAALKEATVSATLLAVSVWGIATILLLSNYWLYRILEGYVGPFNRQKWRKVKQQEIVRKQQAMSSRYEPKADSTVLEPIGEKTAYHRELLMFLKRYPTKEHLVLPTQFGNVIRAFETYPYHVYGIDSIPGWLRLQAVIPKEFQALLNDARAQVDFFVNTLFLSSAIAILAATRCVLDIIANWRCFDNLSLVFPATAIVAIAIARIAYHAAVGLAGTWGDLVKSAFDLYLPSLAKQLGYQLPDTESKRKAFWEAVTSMFLYWTPLDPEAWPKPPDGAPQSEKSKPGGEGSKDEEEDDEKG